MIQVDITIIGAGVVGLSIAREVGSLADNVVVLEKEPGPGRGISSRNSEVIHAGIYYPAESLKARLCVMGSKMLYEFCQVHGIPFKKAGKVIVAVDNHEENAIEQLYIKGVSNDAQGLRIFNKRDLQKAEPNVNGSCALFSPHTGIIDSHRLIKVLEAHCLETGVSIIYRTPLTALEKSSSGFICTACDASGQEYSFLSRIVINSAGLSSDRIASLAGIDADASGYRIFPMKGEYFRVGKGKHRLVNGLVYPIPEKNISGLGIHATKDLSGALRLGPNAFPVETISYEVDSSHAEAFYENARHMLPFLEPEDLYSDMAGIRPKIQKPGETQKDFIISHEDARGLAGMINLVGIESPGLTSCLAIGKYVANMIKEAGLIS
jgi:L-2-hydroxyglutarate oxidase LhgO